MGTTILSDEVISSTQFRANQRHWYDKASEKIITIVNGRKQFALINRDRISNLYAQKHYSELVIRFCDEINRKVKSDTFPWVEYLNDEEKVEFHHELLNTISRASFTDDWSSVEQLIEEWKATAQIINNPVIEKALLEEEDKSKYARIQA